MIVPAVTLAAAGAVATVYVGKVTAPTKPLVDVTGPEKVVELIGGLPLYERIRTVIFVTSAGTVDSTGFAQI